MTPDTRMVTDAEAAEMQAHIMANSDDAVADYMDMAECLLADRERWMALAKMVDATEDADESFPYVLEARKLLKEAHGE